jgi:hypothetical protein
MMCLGKPNGGSREGKARWVQVDGTQQQQTHGETGMQDGCGSGYAQVSRMARDPYVRAKCAVGRRLGPGEG